MTDRRLFWWMFAPQMSTRAQMPQGFQGTGLQFTTPRKGTETSSIRRRSAIMFSALQFTTPRKGTETGNWAFLWDVSTEHYNSLLPVRGRKLRLARRETLFRRILQFTTPRKGTETRMRSSSRRAIPKLQFTTPRKGTETRGAKRKTRPAGKLQFTTPRKGTETG